MLIRVRSQGEVINIRDGRNLGVVTDIEFDMEKGAVQSIIVPGEGVY